MLDEFRSAHITWDKATSRIYSTITANESDENGRKIVQIINGGQVEDLTGSALHLYWITRDKLHDGLDVFKAVDLKKGEFELSYTTGMLSNKGVLNANLVFVDSVGRVVSERFKITVTEGINDDAIQSENSFTTLTQALIDISNLEQNYAPRLNDITAQLQQTATKEDMDNELSKKRNILTKLELEDLSENVLGAIDGSATFNLLSQPQENSVSMKETKYLMAEGVPSKNIFPGWEIGAHSWTTGKQSVSTGKIRSRDYMKVTPSEYIWIDDPESQGSLASNAQVLFEYDENKNFIKHVNINTYMSRGYLPSENCHYVTLQSQTEGTGGFVFGDYENYKTQVEYGMSFTGYETPYPKTKYDFDSFKIIDKFGKGDYKTIQSAVNNAQDSADKPVTLSIMPGIYEESVNVLGGRNLSLVGSNKKDCIIKTTTGVYVDAPIEISGNCYVENLSLIADYTTFPSDVNAQTSYGLHVDYSGEGVAEFNNLYVKSSLTSALGLGTKNNQKIIFRNCVFESDAPDTLNYAKYGAAFLHSSTTPEHTNQRVEFHNCIFRSQNETVLWIADVNGSSEMEVAFYNCMLWSSVSGKADSVVKIFGTKINITDDSYGNNIAILNK